MFCYSIPLLDDSEELRTSIACEGSILHIDCGEIRQINVIHAIYGRLHITICNDDGATAGWDTQCTSPHSLQMVQQM